MSLPWRLTAGAGFVLLLAGAPGCWVARSLPDQVQEAPPVPTGETRRTYYAGERMLRSETRVLVYDDGRVQKHGVEREYYRDGKPKAERHFTHDEPTGVWRTWYAGEVLRSEVDFGDGETPAPMRFWYADGQAEAEGPGLGGVKDGEWTFYHPDGTVSHTGRFAGAKRVGTWSFYDERGQLREQGAYADGQRSGEWKFWDAQGRPSPNATRRAVEQRRR